MAKTKVKEDLIQRVKEYLKRLNAQYPVERAYIFGSQLSGNATEDSDIDLAVISSAFTGDRFTDNVNAGILTWGIDTRIEAVAFRPDDFNNDDMLACEIMKTGIEIRI